MGACLNLGSERGTPDRQNECLVRGVSGMCGCG